MDCTGSMDPWISEAKNNIVRIANETKNSFNKDTYIGFQGYRDFSDKEQFLKHLHTQEALKIETYLQ